MSKTNDIRDRIVAVVAALPEIGPVHAYERYSARRESLRALYVSAIGGRDVLCGWFVRRTGFRARRSGRSGREITTRWEIAGYRAIGDDDASELAFDGQIDAIAEAFHADPTLTGLVQTIEFDDQAGIELADSAPVMFAGVLCHAATLQLKTRHTE